VFVSSTFSDLEDERADVIRTLLNMDCIPAGMELFPASDEEQFEYIKRVIDDCDYYLLIIGGRYGSISPSGLSYTELEYQYAVERGIKVVALIHSKPDQISMGKSETDSSMKEKLDAFRREVSTSRLVKYWEKREELPGLVALNVQAAIKMFPATGWVRANKVSSEQAQGRLLSLEQENLNLRSKIQKIETIKGSEQVVLSKDDEYFEIQYSCELTYKDNNTKTTVTESLNMTWNELFKGLSQGLIQFGNNQMLNKALSTYIFPQAIHRIMEIHGTDATTSTITIDDASMGALLIQFRSLGYITFDGARWRLTEEGDNKIAEVSTVKSETNG